MLWLSKNITNLPIVSLRTGHRVGTASYPIINPANLQIEAWYCYDSYDKKQLILPASEVREIVKQGMAIDDHDAMTEPDDLIRLKPVLEVNFQLINKKVVTKHHRRIGKVDDYAVDSMDLSIQRLYVNRPLYKSLADGQISIDRSRIVEVNNKRIIIKDVDIETKDRSVIPMQATA